MWLPANVPGHRPFLTVDAAGLPQAHGRGAGEIAQNGDPPYAAANVQVLVHWLKEMPLRLSKLHAPGKIANVFAMESFTDELAAVAGADPVAFRSAPARPRRHPWPPPSRKRSAMPPGAGCAPAVPFMPDRVKAALAARPDSAAPAQSTPDAVRQ